MLRLYHLLCGIVEAKEEERRINEKSFFEGDKSPNL
jgi:hypothetical protein